MESSRALRVESIGRRESVSSGLRTRVSPAWAFARLIVSKGSTRSAASLAPVLKDIAELRNPAAHRERFAREQMVPVRDRLVGVGCMGQLAELGKVRLV